MKGTKSLTDKFVEDIERKILSSEWKVGQKVPTLRELSDVMGLSRSVVNAGIMDLIGKGYLRTVPRKWTEVTDWRREGTLAVLNGIMKYDIWSEGVLKSLLDSRMLIECDCAYNAALNRKNEDLQILKHIISVEASGKERGIDEIIRYDLMFHHMIAIASGNVVYPLILKSFENSTHKLVSAFYSHDEVYNYVLDHHTRLLQAIESKDADRAKLIMQELLVHGERITRAEKKEVL